jgi:hypothetical protein
LNCSGFPIDPSLLLAASSVDAVTDFLRTHAVMAANVVGLIIVVVVLRL